MRQSTDVAGVCSEIVKRTAITIKGKKYVRVEGWQSIATAYGCVAGARDVDFVNGGIRAIGELRKISDGTLIATAEGFVGEDEYTWFGGEDPGGKKYPARPVYAIRAMAQTRAISRVCRSAFAHVVILIDSRLSTTPAEEVPYGGFQENDDTITERQEAREAEVTARAATVKPVVPQGVDFVEDPLDRVNKELELQGKPKKHGYTRKNEGVAAH